MVRINILSGPMMAPSDSDFLGGGGGGVWTSCLPSRSAHVGVLLAGGYCSVFTCSLGYT